MSVFLNIDYCLVTDCWLVLICFCSTSIVVSCISLQVSTYISFLLFFFSLSLCTCYCVYKLFYQLSSIYSHIFVIVIIICEICKLLIPILSLFSCTLLSIITFVFFSHITQSVFFREIHVLMFNCKKTPVNFSCYRIIALYLQKTKCTVFHSCIDFFMYILGTMRWTNWKYIYILSF